MRSKISVCDDLTLLRAIRAMSDPDLISPAVQILLDLEDFQILKENEQLKNLLQEYLTLQYQVLVESAGNPTPALASSRQEAFKKYEMLRRMVCWDNKLLRRYPKP